MRTSCAACRPARSALELRGEQRDVEIAAGGARFHLRTLPAEDFPRLPALEGETAKLAAKPLAETIDLVARAASRDEVRPILTGVLVQAEGNRLTMVATDSYRLSVKHTELESPVSQPLEANVPARALRELARDPPPASRTRSRSRCRATRSSSGSAVPCSRRG